MYLKKAKPSNSATEQGPKEALWSSCQRSGSFTKIHHVYNLPQKLERIGNGPHEIGMLTIPKCTWKFCWLYFLCSFGILKLQSLLLDRKFYLEKCYIHCLRYVTLRSGYNFDRVSILPVKFRHSSTSIDLSSKSALFQFVSLISNINFLFQMFINFKHLNSNLKFILIFHSQLFVTFFISLCFKTQESKEKISLALSYLSP